MFGLSRRGWEHFHALYELVNPQQVQRRLLADMRALSADYVRSPAFLALMRASLGSMTSATRMLSSFRIR